MAVALGGRRGPPEAGRRLDPVNGLPPPPGVAITKRSPAVDRPAAAAADLEWPTRWFRWPPERQ